MFKGKEHVPTSTTMLLYLPLLTFPFLLGTTYQKRLRNGHKSDTGAVIDSKPE
jgi:hypothetical protein